MVQTSFEIKPNRSKYVCWSRIVGEPVSSVWNNSFARMSRVFNRGEIRQHCNFVYINQLFVLINEDVTQAAVYPQLPWLFVALSLHSLHTRNTTFVSVSWLEQTL